MNTFKFSLILISTISMVTLPAHAFQNLKYPADCKNKILETAAKKNGCSVSEGKGHKLVFKNGLKITEIPNSVKANNTCRAIIKVLNTQC